MRRPHRRWHWWIWLVLPVILGGTFLAALVLRPAASVGNGPLVSGSAR